MSAQILVVKPKTLTAADKKLLREAGVVCIEAADPSSVRLIEPEMPTLGGDELFYAAMKAIRDSQDITANRVFAHTVAKLVEQHLQEPTP